MELTNFTLNLKLSTPCTYNLICIVWKNSYTKKTQYIRYILIYCDFLVYELVPIIQIKLYVHGMDNFKFYICDNQTGRSQWPRGLRRRSAAERLLGLWVRIPPGAWIFLSCSVCVVR
jgi:hypothetical protein